MALALAAQAWPKRVVIAIDIDSFYVACERLLDPDLIGKPVGIQQKYLLATCSYEARALGCSKVRRCFRHDFDVAADPDGIYSGSNSCNRSKMPNASVRS